MLGAGAGALAAGLLAAAPVLWPRLQADHRTGAGESRALRLPDGSRVELDTRSATAVDLADPLRRIELLQGQAFFAIAADPGHERALAWRSRHLIIEGARLREVPAELGRYLTGRLWPGDAALGERPVTGVFDLRDIRQAVRRAVAPHGGPVQQLTPDPLPVRAA